jgi:hypothetical protein
MDLDITLDGIGAWVDYDLVTIGDRQYGLETQIDIQMVGCEGHTRMGEDLSQAEIWEIEKQIIAHEQTKGEHA